MLCAVEAFVSAGVPLPVHLRAIFAPVRVDAAAGFAGLAAAETASLAPMLRRLAVRATKGVIPNQNQTVCGDRGA